MFRLPPFVDMKYQMNRLSLTFGTKALIFLIFSLSLHQISVLWCVRRFMRHFHGKVEAGCVIKWGNNTQVVLLVMINRRWCIIYSILVLPELETACLFLRIQTSDIDLNGSHRPIGSFYCCLCLCFENQSSFVKTCIMTSLFCKSILNVLNAKPDRLKQMQSAAKNSPAGLHTLIPSQPSMKAMSKSRVSLLLKSPLWEVWPPPSPPAPPQRRSTGAT